MCDEDTDLCLDLSCSSDADCDDSLFCNGTETCADGLCANGASPCLGQQCDENIGSCVDCLTDADCDDDLFCNGSETCQNDTCISGANPCASDETCDEANNACVPQSACADDSDCDDGLFCNGAETCQSGSCVSGTAPCSGQSCDEDTDSCTCSTDADCDDSLFCTGIESCSAGTCVTSGNPCAPGEACDEVTDTCLDGAAITGTISLVATVGARPPVGQITLRFIGSGVWSSYSESITTDVNGNYAQLVPDGWTGTVAADDPTTVFLTPESRAYNNPVTSPQAAQDFDAWHPPIGIPAPDFGIKETHYMYELGPGEDCTTNPEKCYDFGNGPEPYPDFGNGPYTHYVDNTHANATDDGNTFGAPAQPRVTIPFDVPAGSVVEVQGGPYTHDAGQRMPLGGRGTVERPIFVRGTDPASRPIIASSRRISPEGTYIIIELLEFRYKFSIRPRAGNYNAGDPTHHVAIRYSDIHGFNSSGVGIGWPHGGCASHPQYCVPTLAHDVVIYSNSIHDLGDWQQTGSSEDHIGVKPGINSYRTWVVDNELYHIDGDAMAIHQHGILDDPAVQQSPQFVFIGRNDMHHNQENNIDIKVAYDVIVSQNHMYAIDGHSSSSDGTCLVIHEDHATETFPYPERIWLLFNDVHDCLRGFRIQYSDEVYVIGNVIHDINTDGPLMENSGYSSGAAIQMWTTRTVNILYNTVYRSDLGILHANYRDYSRVVIANNIVADLTDNYSSQFGAQPYQILVKQTGVAEASEMHHTLLYQNGDPIRIRWGGSTYDTIAAFQAGTGKGEGCVEEAPLFIDGPNNDFRLRVDSPAVDTAGASEAYERFLALYGIDISVDFEGGVRPVDILNWPIPDMGLIFDMGAFEYPLP